jgi:hypothetical protein
MVETMCLEASPPCNKFLCWKMRTDPVFGNTRTASLGLVPAMNHIDEAEKSNLMFGFGKDWDTDPVEVGSKDVQVGDRDRLHHVTSSFVGR